MPLTRSIVFFNEPCVLACDGRCDKAWGINGRPSRQLSAHEDDYVFLGDDELGVAPGPGDTVGISEGSDMKPSAVPLTDASLMNKWCARECERSDLFEPGEEIALDDPRYRARCETCGTSVAVVAASVNGACDAITARGWEETACNVARSHATWRCPVCRVVGAPLEPKK